MASQQNDFIKVFDKMLQLNSKHRLNENELYIYCVLHKEEKFNKTVSTILDLLTLVMPSPFVKTEKDNKAKIKEALIGLYEKNILIVHNDIDIYNLKAKTLLIVSLNYDLLSRSNSKHSGFERLYYNKFNQFDSARDCFIYCHAAKWSKGSTISYKQWAEFLDVTDRQAKNIIKDAVQRGVIYVNTGDYIKNDDKYIQEMNTYHTDAVDEANKTERQKKKDNEEEIKQNVRAASYEYDEFELKEALKVFKSKQKIDAYEYVIYQTIEDKYNRSKHLDKNEMSVYVAANERFDQIRKSEKGNGKLDNLYRRAKRLLADESAMF
ncbi:hypothetical protein [Salsuginibacillus kocurii]|uniref:hypothetical protein n=1 Tax=Salsuginibacillus kocurii TaxID=427078 RepID=UPI0003777A92|nr:hypothetical protein [Salsuginibacillus kocurii]